MKYLVIEIQTSEEGMVGNIVYSFDSWYEAQSKYHSVLASAAISLVPIHSAAMLTNAGGLIASMCYDKTKEEVTDGADS